MNKLVARAALFGATSILAVGTLASAAHAQIDDDVRASQAVEAVATQTANYAATVCINDNTTGACSTLEQGQSFDRFPTYNGNEQISISVMPEGGDSVFQNVRVSGATLEVVLSGSAQNPVVEVR